jgi:hypothetical protein
MQANASDHLTPRDAAKYIGLAPTTMAKIRCRSNDGPRFMRLGRKILYARSDLDTWLAARRASSTSDADARLPRRLTDNVASAT